MTNDTLLTLIAGTLGIAPSAVTETSGITNTQKWDSMRHIMLMTELEGHYGVVFTDEQMMETDSVAKIRLLLTQYAVA